MSGSSYVITGSKNSQIDTLLYLVKTNSIGMTGCSDDTYPGVPDAIIAIMNPIPFASNDVPGSSNFQLTFQYLPLTIDPLCEILTGIETIGGTPVIYPNPVKDFLFLDRIPGLKYYKLSDMSGNKILSDESQVVDFRNIRPGLYIIEIETSEGSSAYEVIKSGN